ncbi:MAG: hypothetical protein M1820_006070 [Bogoriella megaspora]|nr:MAG: hypothetical protein M1820_006070 [Bogoriella megaspora]
MSTPSMLCRRCYVRSIYNPSKTHNQLKRPRNSFSTSSNAQRQDSDPTSSYFPIFSPSFWRSLFPKRSRTQQASSQSAQKVHWLQNPSTHIIFLALLAGSQAIQILQLKRDHMNYSLRTDAHIAKLREVIGRVQKGEDVDVKKELGTGDPKREEEWEEVMRELEKEPDLSAGKKRKGQRTHDSAASGGKASAEELQGETTKETTEREGSIQLNTATGAPPSPQVREHGSGQSRDPIRFY